MLSSENDPSKCYLQPEKAAARDRHRRMILAVDITAGRGIETTTAARWAQPHPRTATHTHEAYCFGFLANTSSGLAINAA